MHTPRYLLPLIAIVATSIALASQYTKIERHSLFNGKNLDGWVVENNGQFFVVDGNLRVERGTTFSPTADLKRSAVSLLGNARLSPYSRFLGVNTPTK